jgi:hypothetical protein
MVTIDIWISLDTLIQKLPNFFQKLYLMEVYDEWVGDEIPKPEGDDPSYEDIQVNILNILFCCIFAITSTKAAECWDRTHDERDDYNENYFRFFSERSQYFKDNETDEDSPKLFLEVNIVDLSLDGQGVPISWSSYFYYSLQFGSMAQRSSMIVTVQERFGIWLSPEIITPY